MKFLCDNCKAKYQIADEKVAGKTVRMKCRKCGHLIEVKAAVTETSVAKSTPPPGPLDGDDKTVVGPPPAALSAMAAKAPAAKIATSLTSTRPPAQKQSPPKESALAGAFQRTVQRDEPSAQRSLRELQAADQWYVAINGVPVGPIRMSELRRKAAVGAVTEDSLVWQEGLEEWRPLRTYPELAEAVREAIAGGRPSLTPHPPSSLDALVAARPVGAPQQAPHPAPSPQPARVTPAPAAARSNVVPITSRLATAEKLEEAPEPFAAPKQPEPVKEPERSVPAAPAAQILLAPPPVLGMEPKRGVPWIPIAMVVLAAGFGVTAAYAIFFRTPVPQPAPVVIVSAAPNPNPPPTATAATTEPPATAVAPPDSAAPVATNAVRQTPAGPKGTATASSSKPFDPAIAALLSGSPGAGPAVGTGGGQGPGGSLTSDQIEAVVRSHQTGVKRTCWERSGSQLSAVNVTAHLTIGPTGTVSSAEVDGNDPVVAKCIENQVKTWQFPATGSTSQANIPFHFLRQ